MASEMSDVEILESNDQAQIPDYTPIVSKRGTKKYWKVENNIECTKHIKKQLKVSFDRLMLTLHRNEKALDGLSNAKRKTKRLGIRFMICSCPQTEKRISVAIHVCGLQNIQTAIVTLLRDRSRSTWPFVRNINRNERSRSGNS